MRQTTSTRAFLTHWGAWVHPDGIRGSQLLCSSFGMALTVLLVTLAVAFWGFPLAAWGQGETHILHVDIDAGGVNDGSSWADAFIDLQQALSVAEPGDEIWVAAGTYTPTSGADRSISFVLSSAVAVYGGFAGTETLRHERDWVANLTVLSGEIGAAGTNDNSYHVVVGATGAVIDGFTVMAGNASGTAASCRGGGMYNAGNSPAITNVTFSANSAYAGGGMYNLSCSPVLTAVTFSANSAYAGGGMYNLSCSPVLTAVTFSANSAYDGGGMYNERGAPRLTNVFFSANSATNDGGGMCDLGSSPALADVTFSANSATHDGGGLCAYGSSPALTDVAFSGNTAGHNGGGMHSSYPSCTSLSNLIFSGNSATCDGGGMYNHYSSPALSDVVFSDNSAAERGGGMANYVGSPTLTNVAFSGNSARTHGGAMFNEKNSAPSLVNVAFSANGVHGPGGGMYNDMSTPTLINCTFSANSGIGCIINSFGSHSTLVNCILWGDIWAEEILGDASSSAAVIHTVVQGGFAGTGNLDADPLFVDAGVGDLHLQAGSPAIDSGIGTGAPAFDFDGVTRPQDGDGDGTAEVDMGAHEYDPSASPVNHEPLAVADSYALGEDGVLAASSPGLLGNDLDPDGDALTAGLVTGASHGTLNLNVDGSFTYTPAADYTGPDSFSYVANDGTADSEPATVSITVTPENDPPVADAGGPYSIDGGQVLALDGAGSNDPDGTPEEEGLICTWDLNGDGLFGDAEGVAAHLAWSALSALTPAIPFNQAVTVALMVTDAGGLASTALTTLTIVDAAPPAIAVPQPITAEARGAEGAPVSFTVSATDAVDGPVAAIAMPSSGSVFPLGESAVKVTARDAAGNSASEQFTVTVVDTTAPVLCDVPGDIALEANGPTGAVAIWTSPTATDLVDASVTPTADHQSGDTFPLGTTTITYTATDAHHNSATASFTVTVTEPADTTPPVIAVPAGMTEEATGPDGATVTFADEVSALDAVDGEVHWTATPASGSVFPLGMTRVTVTAADEAGNEATAGFQVTVRDTTPPVVAAEDLVAEATGPRTDVTLLAMAVDQVDGDVEVSYTMQGGGAVPADGFALGQHALVAAATDAHGNTGTMAFTLTVRDTTMPVLSGVPAGITAEAIGPSGTTVSWTAPTATDLVDGSPKVTCSPASGSIFALGTSTVEVTATDASGNKREATFVVTVKDTKGPVIPDHASMTVVATDASGAVVTWADITATDAVDGDVAVTCMPTSGSAFRPGSTTVAMTAVDSRGNASSKTFSVTVGYSWTGFFQPVDNPGSGPTAVFNVVKAGSSVPVKFSLGGDMGLSVLAAGYPRSVAASEGTTAMEDLIEETLPLGTASGLKYDASAGQYVYVWKTEKSLAGTCRTLQLKLADGSMHYANFRFK